MKEKKKAKERGHREKKGGGGERKICVGDWVRRGREQGEREKEGRRERRGERHGEACSTCCLTPSIFAHPGRLHPMWQVGTLISRQFKDF